MQEYTSPGMVAVPPEENLTTSLWSAARAYPRRPAVAHRIGSRFVAVSTSDFVERVTDLARGLLGLGVEPGARVCILSWTRLEWTLLDYACWAVGAVPVPIYETSSPDQIAWILGDSGAVALICENESLRATYDEIAAGGDSPGPGVEHVFVIEAGGLERLERAGEDVSVDDVMERAHAVTGDDLATIVYTSGTTGRPKGCEITHHNFVWDAAQVQSVSSEFVRSGASTLLFLPLAHIFARVIQVACIRAGVTLGYATGMEHLLEELGLFRPTFLLAVPRVFEKVYDGARQKAHADHKGAVFDRAAEIAIRHSREEAAGGPSLATRAQHAVFDRLVYARLRDALGGQVGHAVSGGAALGERLGHFFNGIGIRILEGYGLTETTAGATLNRPDAYRIGTVGKPLPGVTVRLAEDGEVLVRGDNVFRGYHDDPDATDGVFDGDWLRTGDLGSLDDEGFLRITGRKKDLIVTAAGKNVAPAVLEDRLRAHRLVSQAMVVGDGQPFVAALVAIDPDAFADWAAEHGLGGKTVADLVDDPRLRDTIQEAVEDANRAVSRAESVRTFRIVPEDFSVADGQLTPTLKVRRTVVAEQYADLVDDIYGPDDAAG